MDQLEDYPQPIHEAVENEGAGGKEGTEGVAVVVGVQGGEEVGGGFVVWARLEGDPVEAEAVAQASEHSHKEHRPGFAHAAEVVEVAGSDHFCECPHLGKSGLLREQCREVFQIPLGHGFSGGQRDGFSQA
jgi:hypothetical protein